MKLRRRQRGGRRFCTPSSPHYPRHRFTSRHRTQQGDTWGPWIITCCWCGQEKQ